MILKGFLAVVQEPHICDYNRVERTERERDQTMMTFKMTHEDGDYQVFHSTNHADPDRIGTIVVDHALQGSDDRPSATYVAFVEDQDQECVSFDEQGFFDDWDKAQRYLETICSMKIKMGQRVR